MKLVLPTQDFVRALKAVSFATAPDETRARLNSVWIVAAGQHSHMFATSGHWLAVVRIPNPLKWAPGQVPIERAEIARILSAAPRGSGLGPVTVTSSGASTTVDFVERSVTVRRHECTPPPIYKLVPRVKSTGKHERRSINLAVLRPALAGLQAMSPSKRKLAGARFYPMGTSALDPVLLWSSQAPDFFAYLMPMRSEAKRDMSWWDRTCDAMLAAAPEQVAAE